VVQGQRDREAGDCSWRDAPEAWQRSLRELAVSLEADWPALGRSH
jgi:hypothetical protein